MWGRNIYSSISVLFLSCASNAQSTTANTRDYTENKINTLNQDYLLEVHRILGKSESPTNPLPIIQDGTPEDIYPTNPMKYEYPEKKEINIDSTKLGDCLAYAVESTFPDFTLNRGEMIRSYDYEEFYKYLSAGYTASLNFKDPNKILITSTTKRNSALYKTGNEEKLKAWILSQPDNSIDPVSILISSLKINHGNVWNAVLTIHDLLRNNARYYHKARYDYPTSQGIAEAVFNKFIDLRGDLRDRGPGFGGDHFGSWYRIWGVMLFRMTREPEYYANRSCSGSGSKFAELKKIHRLLIKSEIHMGAYWQEMQKLSRNDETDKHGKVKLDIAADDFSEQMIDVLWPASGDARKPTPTEWNKCLARDYLSYAR